MTSPENIASGDAALEREKEILGKPPRIAPLDREANAAFISESSLRLRRGARGAHAADVKPLPLDQIHEIVVTLLRHPGLWESICALSIQLLGTEAKLTARDRELAVLRITWLWGAPYAWGEHTKHAKRAGISSEEIERITEGSAAPGWDPFESAILRAAEELHDGAMISDATWEVLASRLDECQLFELTVLIGQFTNIAYFQNALRLRLSPDNPGLAGR
jgi:alkylhydroperoxidase family enzyme